MSLARPVASSCSKAGQVLAGWERGAELGQLRRPSGVAVDEDSTVYVADQGNGRIQQFPLLPVTR